MIDVRFWERARSNELWGCNPDASVGYYDKKHIIFKELPLRIVLEDKWCAIGTKVFWNGANVTGREGPWDKVFEWVMENDKRIKDDDAKREQERQRELLEKAKERVEVWLKDRESEGS